MESIDDSDDWKFKVNFTDEGVKMLKEKLNEKLKELMGNYTDEILVDYVIVLLRNGRGKDHAKNKLNVFLGDNSDSFVSWLWDHLALNIDLYVQSKGLQDESPKSKLPSKVQADDDGFQNLTSKSERVRSRSRRNKDWKGLVGKDTEAPPPLSIVVDSLHLDEKSQSKVKHGPIVRNKKVKRGPRPPPPAPPVQRKRGYAVVEQQKTKRGSVSQVTIGAPRRLLQCAVRDAVATSRPSSLGTPVEPSLKRPRSAVSSSYVESSMVEHPHRMQTISRVANPMSTVFKAVEEADEDVVKLKSSGSAFDWIGNDMYPSYGNMLLEDNQYQEQSPFLYHRKKYYGDPYAANMTMLDHETGSPSDSKVENPMSTVFKAVEEAAEDVVKLKSSGSAFDWIGNDMYPSYGNMQLEDNQYQEQSPFLYHRKKYYGDPYAANMTMLDHETGSPSDSSSDNEGYDDVNFMGNSVGRVSQLSSSGGKRGDDSLMVHYNVAKNDDDSMLLKKNKNQEQSAAAPNSSKIVNISVNVNAWNPSVLEQYLKPRQVVELSGHKTINSGTGALRSGLSMVNENAKTVKINNGKVKPTLDLLKETQKAQAQPPTPGTGSSAPSCPLDDADSRTIFASNVHFAATKDAISRHFNKFGEVLEAVIVTGSITGQPKGAAYVEFMHKEAADNALSLDGTSFMSRILKVVRKSAAQHQDCAPAVPWPRGVKGSPYHSARFLRAPIPSGISGEFTPRPPVKFGARSLQWKRDAQGTSFDNGATLKSSSISAPVSRGLTYVRAESMLDGSSSTR